MFERAQTLPCPSCGQIISDRVGRCRFCGAPVDPAVAREAAAVQARVNRACSDASYLRIVASSMWVFLFIHAGFATVLLNFSFLAMFAVLPVLIARWQLRFGRIETRDPDFAKARRAKNLSLALWLAALVAAFVILPRLPTDVSFS